MTDYVSSRSVSLSLAIRALDAAIAEAERLDCHTSIAIVDSAGHLVTFARMDGSPLLGLKLAQDKAYSAAIHGVPTSQWWELIADDPSLVHGINLIDRLIIFGGGVPAFVDADLVAGVGVSGRSSPDQDEAIAIAAAQVISHP
ncbi:heme-binding protein [soil metagenome]